MSVENVRKFFKENELDYHIYDFEESTATVALAAQVHGVTPNEIAKTLAFVQKDKNILLVTVGGARIDNQKYKAVFGEKAKMMNLEDVEEITGHPVGGVCPFGLKTPMEIYLDVSIFSYDYVYPAAGSQTSSIKIAPDELLQITSASKVDVCKDY
ncbi:MAG: YbaK/EbsC family protein [Eubacteriales bacterium]